MLNNKIAHRMMERARLEASYSTCPAAQVGCVIALGDLVLSTGYNGAPRGIAHCTEKGCIVQPASLFHSWKEDGACEHWVQAKEVSRHVHAEANAIAAAAKHGRATDTCTAYITIPPCIDCAKLLIQAGITAVYFGGTLVHNTGFLLHGAYDFLLSAGVLAKHIDLP